MSTEVTSSPDLGSSERSARWAELDSLIGRVSERPGAAHGSGKRVQGGQGVAPGEFRDGTGVAGAGGNGVAGSGAGRYGRHTGMLGSR